MNSSMNPLLTANFKHIYIEEQVKNHPRTAEILSHFQKSSFITIDHYKDIFNRAHQNYQMQKQAINLILAKKEKPFFYPGAPVCQNFGEQHFYYTSLLKNCIYDCEYCYLQGMYPSANLVLFVNIEDYFSSLESLLSCHPVYLCISYDTDLLALESLTGYCKQWLTFLDGHKNLTIELRTKSSNLHALSPCKNNDHFILAWTLSPNQIQQQFEHHTPTLAARIKNVNLAIQSGWPVRLCFDPMIYVHNWKEIYDAFIHSIASQIDLSSIRDFSIGVFRIASCYQKAMLKARPDSLITCFPYENNHGVCHYNEALSHEMADFLKQRLLNYVNEKKLYLWEEAKK